MSIHTGQKILASIGNIIQVEVKTKTRGIHHHYRKLIQKLIDVYEDQCSALVDKLEAVMNKSLKYIRPCVSLPIGVSLPQDSYLSRESLNIDRKFALDPNSEVGMKPSVTSKPQIIFVNRKPESANTAVSKPEPVVIKPAVFESKAGEVKIVPVESKLGTTNSAVERKPANTIDPVERKLKPAEVDSRSEITKPAVVDSKSAFTKPAVENKIPIKNPVINSKNIQKQFRKPFQHRNRSDQKGTKPPL